MSQDEDPISAPVDLPLTLEKRFTNAELIACPACSRANAPTRLKCIYCGAELPVTEAAAALQKPTLRPLEDWERGFNIVLVKGIENVTPQLLGEVTSYLRIHPEGVKLILGTGAMTPLTRAESLAEASMIEERLRALGVETVIVADAALGVETIPPKRVRSLEMMAEGLVGRDPGAESRLPIRWEEIYLVVAGRLFVSQVEGFKSALRGKPDVGMARELSVDEAVMDIFTRKQDGGWRLHGGGFDFSCLGDRKGLLAPGNFRVLTEMLRQRAPQAEFDDSYSRMRQALSVAWPMEQQNKRGGVHRVGLAKYNVGGVTISDNEIQFTRYSRLRHNFKLRGF